MSAIEVRGLTKAWGTTHAVDGVDFRVEEGEFLALLGPSGCGKSTTLRLIAGLDQPTSGSIVIGGRDVTELPPARRAPVFRSHCSSTAGPACWRKSSNNMARAWPARTPAWS